jgi:hypothetical protein
LPFRVEAVVPAAKGQVAKAPPAAPRRTRSRSQPPTFVELLAPRPVSSQECRVELEGPRGRRSRGNLRGASVAAGEPPGVKKSRGGLTFFPRRCHAPRRGERLSLPQSRDHRRPDRVHPATDGRPSRSDTPATFAAGVRGVGMEAAERGTARHGLSRALAGSRPRRTHHLAGRTSAEFRPGGEVLRPTLERGGGGSRYDAARGPLARASAAGISSGAGHAGKNLARVLVERAKGLAPPIQMPDALSRNAPKPKTLSRTEGMPEKLAIIWANCNARARRRFGQVTPNFPEECRFVLESLRDVCRYDAEAEAQGLSREARLRYHPQPAGDGCSPRLVQGPVPGKESGAQLGAGQGDLVLSQTQASVDPFPPASGRTAGLEYRRACPEESHPSSQKFIIL